MFAQINHNENVEAGDEGRIKKFIANSSTEKRQYRNTHNCARRKKQISSFFFDDDDENEWRRWKREKEKKSLNGIMNEQIGVDLPSF